MLEIAWRALSLVHIMLFVASVFLRDIQLKFYVDFFFEVITVRNWVEIY